MTRAVIDSGDYILTPCGSLGSKTCVSVVDGGFLGMFDSDDDALQVARRDMRKRGFYPNIWAVSDHGNIELVR